uniref:ribonuclease III n=1 Tax=Mayetiola destructor TaxID=39758 RepID=K7YL18_MAYDE|nr:dicer 1 [Mayetiola destructor]
MAAFHWQDNLSLTAFTPRDFQVELLAAAIEQNIIICLGHNSSKEFIALKLILEKSHELRQNVNGCSKKITLFLANTTTGSESMYNLLFHLTDLKVINIRNNVPTKSAEWMEIICDYHVIILSASGCVYALQEKWLDLKHVNLIIIDECHKIYTDSNIVQLYCTRPTELIIQCLPPTINCEVSQFLRDVITSKKQFLLEHRYDPFEIYSDQFEDELRAIPDPKKEPLDCLEQLLDVLNEFGPWCADRAALNLIAQIEKLKIKTPYERHYLLLCLVSTALIQIRSHCEHIFNQFDNDRECIEKLSSPKAIRLLEILRQFKPDKLIESQATNSPVATDLKLSSNIENNLNNGIDEKTKENDSKMLQEKSSNHKTNNEKQLNEYTVTKSKLHQSYNGKKSKNTVPKLARNHINNYQNDPNALCGLIFCDSIFTAKALFSFINEMTKHDSDLEYLSVQYTGDRIADPVMESKQFENEHRKQEEVLKRFRMHSCNLLIGTSVLEEGIELPKCNLVVRWNLPTTYRSYVQCKGRARAQKAHHIIMVSTKLDIDPKSDFQSFSDDDNERICPFAEKTVRNYETKDKSHKNIENVNASNSTIDSSSSINKMEEDTVRIVEQLAEYMEIERILLEKCSNQEPTLQELIEADLYTNLIKPYRPIRSDDLNTPCVSLTNAILLVNKYCAKLPSDTFTKLTPIWRCIKTKRGDRTYYQYTVRLPINSPVKQDIYGIPMPSRVLARRFAGLICCKVLHLSGELDDNLQPIGKEGFRASEPDWNNFELEKEDADIVNENLDPRPGTTRRRQYYYKRIASVFSNCRPKVGVGCKLYFIKMVLECPIPEEQNTRGRKIYAPEDAVQGFGILTTKSIPKLGSFSIFTRSGEVRVSLELCSENWSFLELIAHKSDHMPQEIPDAIRKEQKFSREKFRDAVVMPWYRNQDQPQYFYVAEICDYLSPESSFPGESYATFKEYYFRKYNITIQNCQQPLLDVDHTSARLNFLTPRYVNRKGVALPTSSEETKKAKRENLEQKQILVPELCTIHSFPASLWRIAVCLPCVFYRINALLLADEIRIEVATDINLGKCKITDDTFDWPTLDFGWKLADVLRRAKDSKPKETKKLTELVQCEPDRQQSSNDTIIEQELLEEDLLSENTKPKTNLKDKFPNVEKNLEDVCLMEIGTWSNTMAENITMSGEDDDDEEDWNGILPALPPNISICSRSKLNVHGGSPSSWDIPVTQSALKINCSESDISYSDQSDDDFWYQSNDSYNESNEGLNIEFKSDNLAEAIETEEEIKKRQRKIEIINGINANEKRYQVTKNIGSGYDCKLISTKQNNDKYLSFSRKFYESKQKFEKDIKLCGTLIKHDEPVKLQRKPAIPLNNESFDSFNALSELFSFIDSTILRKYIVENNCMDTSTIIRLSIEDVYALHRIYFDDHPTEEYTIEGNGSVFDAFNDQHCLKISEDNSNIVYILKNEEIFKNRTITREKVTDATEICKNSSAHDDFIDQQTFSFDKQPDLNDYSGPSPSIILQALTMSNANDGINLERLETIGDSFLKYAITTYLYCTYENVHEGKLSHLRSRQVSNLNLYRLGRRKMLGERMIATKFEPHDNWLPPCYYVPKDLEKALIEAKIPACYWEDARLLDVKELTVDEICEMLKKRIYDYEQDEKDALEYGNDAKNESTEYEEIINGPVINRDEFPCFIPYNLVTQHSIPDKSIADCVEALIGANLIEGGPRGALLFMAWLGIRVLPSKEIPFNENSLENIPGSTKPFERDGKKYQIVYGYWASPKSPLLHFSANPYETLERFLNGYSVFEEHIGYHFNDRSYLLQAMTHASYSQNRLTDCYQRLEFLGDAVLDYLITRHLYEDPRQHSPGALTDLRSALVNNTIFASLAVRHGFHKYFRHLSPSLNDVIDRFVRIQVENNHSISEEFYLISEEECDEAEDVEVPKALGDIFESVAGAIFLDSNMSLDMVWKIFSNMMKPEIDQFSDSVPKSPIRELLELEPETAKFGKPEKLADGRRVRVTVDVFGKGTYRGIGRNYRIAKCTAAKCALRQLKKQGLINRKRTE